jgi:hypothetical protein
MFVEWSRSKWHKLRRGRHVPAPDVALYPKKHGAGSNSDDKDRDTDRKGKIGFIVSARGSTAPQPARRGELDAKVAVLPQKSKHRPDCLQPRGRARYIGIAGDGTLARKITHPSAPRGIRLDCRIQTTFHAHFRMADFGVCAEILSRLMEALYFDGCEFW